MEAGTTQSAARLTPRRSGPKVLVNVATYNERDNIVRLISEIHQFAPQAHILVVDDNSPDGTGKVVDELASKDPRIHPLHRAGKLGLGTAILAGMRFAIEHSYDLMVNMDADFSHPPRYIPDLLAGMAERDVMIGSRYIIGGGCVNWPISRRMMSKGVNAIVRLLFRMQVKDASGGFRCYRVAKLRQTMLDGLYSRGYSFQQEMLYPVLPGRLPARRDADHFRQSKIRQIESQSEGKRSLALDHFVHWHSLGLRP